MEILLVLILLLLLIAIFLLWKKNATPPASVVDNSQSLIMMQQQVESLRTEMQRSLTATTESLSGSLKNSSDVLFQSMSNTTSVVQQQLAQVTTQLNHTTENVNKQLTAITQQMQTQTGSIGDRLDGAAKVIGEVQRNLGELGKVATEMKEVGQNVTALNDLLRAPKFRGGFGETMLEDMLKQILPAEHYDTQYRFRSGQQVDAVIHTAGGIVPVDSKFPLENFRKFNAAETDAEKKSARKLFISDVKKHVDAISTKYILADEGTLNFALMYIPAENIYYETIIKDDVTDGDSLFLYATKARVVPVSPNSLYAYLQVIALGLKGLQIEKTAQQILNNIDRLGGDFGKVREVFDILGSHLDNARKKYDESDKKLRHVEERLSSITTSVLEHTGEQTKLL